MAYWLMKSEPSECSIDDVANEPTKSVPWVGVRNFQARNYMRKDMQVGDGVLFYHSSCPEPGIAGLAEVASAPYPDATQFDPASHYHDEKSRRESPRSTLMILPRSSIGRRPPPPPRRSPRTLPTCRGITDGR